MRFITLQRTVILRVSLNECTICKFHEGKSLKRQGEDEGVRGTVALKTEQIYAGYHVVLSTNRNNW